MEQDKIQLEDKINKIVTSLFSLKKSDDFDESEYKTLFTKLSDLIWRWAKITFGQKIENASIEIMECIKRSITSFNECETEYIKYISASLSKEIEKANRKNQLNERELIKIPQKKRNKINQILKYTERYGKNLNSENDIKKIASVFNQNSFDIKEHLQWKHQSEVLQDCAKSSDDEDYSLTDSFVSEHNFTYNPETNFFINDENLEDEKKLEDLFCLIENLYLEEKDKTENQKTSKQYLGALITRQILEDLSKIPNLSQSKIYRMLESKCFSDNTVLELFIQDKLPNQQDIAEWYNKDKTDASRKINTFLRKLQEKMSTERIIDSSYISGGKE